MKYVSLKSAVRKIKVFLSLLLSSVCVVAQDQISQQDTILSLGTEVMLLTKGQTIALPYSIDGADSLTIVWTTSDDSIASVVGDGIITAAHDGRCTITASYCIEKQTQCLVIVGNMTNSSDGYEYVDLGLPSGTLWATMNVGADSPEEAGRYLQWKGDSIPDFDNANMGMYWRIPSLSQLKELVDSTYTICKLTSFNGVEGVLVTGRITDNSLFLPGVSLYIDSIRMDSIGTLCYWSSTCSDSCNLAYGLCASSHDSYMFRAFDSCYRLPVRPVYEGQKSNASIVVNPTLIEFGAVAIGSSRSLSFDIRNNTFQSQTIMLSGMDNEDFSIDWHGGEILPNMSKRVTVTFAPTTTSFVTGGSFKVCTMTDSCYVNITASSHRSGYDLTTKDNLVLWLKDGSKSTFILNDAPVVTVRDGILNISSKTISAEYVYSDVVKMTYEDLISDNVIGISVDLEEPYRFTDDAILFYSDIDDLNVWIMSAGGITVRQFEVQKGESVSLPLSQFSAGVYVINVNNISYKIVIR